MDEVDIPETDWHAEPVEKAFLLLDSSAAGLSQAQAGVRQLRFGPNRLPEPESAGVLRLFLSQFLSPLIYVLLAAAGISLFLAEYADAGFIAAVLLVNAAIGTLQEFHAQKSADALRRMVSARAMVLREGESFEVDASELVPGDVVLLESGGRVPADIRLLSAWDLQVDESLLTGESLPVGKHAQQVATQETPLADRRNMLYSGTLVNRGRGRGIVVATGIATQIGQLAESMLYGEAALPPLLLRMRQFTLGVIVLLGVVVLMLAGVELYKGTGWHEVFLVSVALAVSAIPEGLPVALTVALSIGMNRMARRNVIVRRLVAVEALGSCTVIASDKTGTLTMNRLSVGCVALPGRQAYQVSSADTPAGEVVLDDGLPLSETRMQRLHDIARVAMLCNEGYLARREDGWVSRGDAVDVALLMFAHRLGLTQAEALSSYPLLSSIPYESDTGYAASLHACEGGRIVLVKGAPERLLPMCDSMVSEGGECELDTAMLKQQMEEMAAEGYRVLAFAHGMAPEEGEPANFDRHALHGLTLLGLVGMIDPLRSDVQVAVAACHRAGVRACMITGDHPSTALAIARQIGLADSPSQVVDGVLLREAEAEGQEAMDRLVSAANVFARVEPGQKVSIVQALQRAGHFVAVTGDGANDAPALNASNVGVAMGMRGTDVARESADLVLADDHFASIVAGIEEGRIAYRNIRKVIFLLISTGAAELVLFFLSMAFDLPLPLTAVQLLWLNLVTNGIQDVALAFEPREGNEMEQPPRRPSEPIFNRIMVERCVLSALVIGVLAFITYRGLLVGGMDIEAARNSTLLLMVLFENVHVFNSRSETRSVFYHNPMANPLLLFGTLAAQAVHIAAMYTPGLRTVLDVQPVSLLHWLDLLPVALLLLLVMELHKRLHHLWRMRAGG